MEVSALSVEENADDKNNAKEEESDNEIPPGITMEDLASDLDFTQDDVGDQGRDSSSDKFKKNSTDEKPGQHVVDSSSVGTSAHISAEHPKASKENRIEVDSDGTRNEHIENASDNDENRQSHLEKETSWESLDIPSQRAWHTIIGYHGTESLNKYCHISEFDEDIIMIRAKAALRRANRHLSMDRSLSLSDLSLNTSSTWEPVRMSTPLVPQETLASTNYRQYADHIQSSFRTSSTSEPYYQYDGRESWHSKSGPEMTPYQHYTVTRKTYSPGEDLIRQRKVQQKLEGINTGIRDVFCLGTCYFKKKN